MVPSTQAGDLKAVADLGYFKGEEILACDEAGIEVTLPKSQTSGAQAEGLFGKRYFHYSPEDNEYRFPAGE
jgi:transposase